MTNADSKLIRSLAAKKSRRETNLFVAEGEKVVAELLASDLQVKKIFATKDWKKPAGLRAPVELISDSELAKISQLETPNKVLALAAIPPAKFAAADCAGSISLAADSLRDPGNLGTLIRLADWFGFGRVLCSPDSVDCWNPKVIQASMGSVFRIPVLYADLPAAFIELKNQKLPILAADLAGEDAFEFSYPRAGVLVIGSESHGISPAIAALADAKVTIPRFGRAESLNAAAAAAVLAGLWRRGLS